MKFEENIFHIGVWEGPRKFAVRNDAEAEYRFTEIREAGLDTVFLFAELADEEWLARTLKAAVRCDINLIVDTGAVWRDSAKLADTVIKTRECPKVIAYNVVDEPPAAFFEDVAAASAQIRKLSPDKPVFTNLNPNYAPPTYLPEGATRRERYRKYLGDFTKTVQTDILSMDFYPYLNDPEAAKAMKVAMLENLSDIALESVRTGIPWAGFLQTSCWNGTRKPTEAELRFLANRHLVFGCSMLTDFLYWSRSGTRPDQRVPGVFDGIIAEDGTRTEMYDTVKKINTEIRENAKRLRGCSFRGIMTAGLTEEENEAIGELLTDSFYGKTLPKTDGRIIAGCFLSPDGKPVIYETHDEER